MSVEHLLRALQAFDPLSVFPFIDTPYAEYSTANYAASIIEIPPMRDIVSQCREQLSVIDTILEQIKSTFHKLSNKREQIASSMRMHEGFMSCIRRLPSDVLSDVLMQCLPDATFLTPDIRAAPLLLTQICRGWREVALRTPRLWCSLSIADISRDRVVSPAFSMETLPSFNPGWPNRTRLAVSFEDYRGPVDDTIFLTLLQTCPNLEIFVFSPVFIHSPDNPITLTHSKLRTLAIGPRADRNVSPLHTLIFPNLRLLQVYSLREADTVFHTISEPEGSLPGGLRVVDTTFAQLDIHSFHAFFTVFNPGWTRLSHVRLDAQHGSIYHLLPLQFCPQLEDMVVSINIKLWTTGEHCALPDHHRIRSLTLRVKQGPIDIFLEALTLPSLRHLSLTMESDWPRTSFNEFFSRPSCPLEKLEIHGPKASAVGREEFTSLIPSLSQLSRLARHIKLVIEFMHNARSMLLMDISINSGS